MSLTSFDAIVVGGGFYGASIALYLATERRLGRVLLVEQEAGLMRRASQNNQARVHNGYHYPRSLKTAHSSRINFAQFSSDWRECIESRFTKIYAVARHGSATTPKRFEAFCARIGAPCAPAAPKVVNLFARQTVSAVYLTEEPAFDALALAGRLTRRIEAAGVLVACSTRASNLTALPDGAIGVTLMSAEGQHTSASAPYVFNCAYSGLNQLAQGPNAVQTELKHEIAQMLIVEPPPALQAYGVTVIDGPFFSSMPYPTSRAHSVSHVKYTPERRWTCSAGLDPYAVFANSRWRCRADPMLRDAARFVPLMRQARLLGHIREVKTVLKKSAVDDSRPILFEASDSIPGLYAVLGGKLDNIYDVMQVLDTLRFPQQQRPGRAQKVTLGQSIERSMSP